MPQSNVMNQHPPDEEFSPAGRCTDPSIGDRDDREDDGKQVENNLPLPIIIQYTIGEQWPGPMIYNQWSSRSRDQDVCFDHCRSLPSYIIN